HAHNGRYPYTLQLSLSAALKVACINVSGEHNPPGLFIDCRRIVLSSLLCALYRFGHACMKLLVLCGPPAPNLFNTHLAMQHPHYIQVPNMTTAPPTPITLAKLSPPPANNIVTRKAGFANVTFGPRRITFSEPVPPYPPTYDSVQPPAPRPLGVRMREIHEHGTMVRRWVDISGDERPLAPFVDQKVPEIIVAIWAPDKTGGWKHYYRPIPINKAYKTDRKDGLALAVVVEFTQLCPEFLKYRLVALNRMVGNAYWAELGYA
ncbi:hypothetical protein LXA43DRAFT_1147894, partial [Ganoderma leucocontextum]